jgi:hypothetical protein
VLDVVEKAAGAGLGAVLGAGALWLMRRRQAARDEGGDNRLGG